jgi:hypothetical protein
MAKEPSKRTTASQAQVQPKSEDAPAASVASQARVQPKSEDVASIVGTVFGERARNFWVALTRAARDPRYAAGLAAGIALTFSAALVPLPPPQDTLWSKVIGEPNLFPKPVYLRLSDTTEPAGKQEMTRELVLYGYVNLHGTYKNLQSGNTGQVVGFRRGNVLQLVFAEDPDAQGRARSAVGSIKVEQVQLDNKKLIAYVGHEEGCDCSGNNTTTVAAILTDTELPPDWLKKKVFTKKTINIDFLRASDVTNDKATMLEAGL